MKKLMALALVSTGLAGCAAQVVSSNPRSVVVSAFGRQAGEAQDLASAEYARHQRFARMTARPNDSNRQFIFDCVN